MHGWRRSRRPSRCERTGIGHGATLLWIPFAAHSDQITYAFTVTVTGGSSGPLALQTATGYFTYDSSIIPAGGGSVTEGGLLTGLSLTWDGISYTAQMANTSQIFFSSNGALLAAFFGSDCPGGVCSLLNGSTDWVIDVGPSSDFFPNSFQYDVPGHPFAAKVSPMSPV